MSLTNTSEPDFALPQRLHGFFNSIGCRRITYYPGYDLVMSKETSSKLRML